MRRFDTFSELQEVPVHQSIGLTWADSYQTPEIGLAEGVMKLAEGVTSKLCFFERIFVTKMDTHIRAEDPRKRRNTIGGAGH